MKRVRKIILWIVGILAVLCIAILLICNQLVVNNAKGKVFNEIDSIKYRKVGLLLGTTPQARLTKATNYFFIYRIDAAEQLYKAGKIEKILISGDEHSLDGINEPECMRDSLMARGIPISAIILDGEGYRTICSVLNGYNVYGLKSFTIISQKFHNERALYQAEHLGLDVKNIQAFNAKSPKSKRALITYAREYLARVKMFWDLLTYKEPNYYDNKANLILDNSMPKDTIQSFLGKQLLLNDSVYEQISFIASQDKMLSYKDSILQIGDVRWRVNFVYCRNPWESYPCIRMQSNIQLDDPKMKMVIRYMNSKYGKPYSIDENSIGWSSSEDSDNTHIPGCTLVSLFRYEPEEGTILKFSTFYYFYY